jgi:hypothetical protein
MDEDRKADANKKIWTICHYLLKQLLQRSHIKSE